MLAIEFEGMSEGRTNADDTSSESEEEMSVSTPERDELRRKRGRTGDSVSFGNLSGISGVGASHELSSSEGEQFEGGGNEVKKPRFASGSQGDESKEDNGILAADGTMEEVGKLVEQHEKVPLSDPGPSGSGEQFPPGGTE